LRAHCPLLRKQQPLASNAPILVVRQPIFDESLQTVGYEILHRPVESIPETAGASAPFDWLLELGLEAVVGPQRAWIRVTRPILTEHLYEFLPAERVVFEIAPGVEADTEVIRALTRVRKLGYRIALGDYMPGERSEPLLELAQVVMLDRRHRGEELGSTARRLRENAHEVVAQGVETYDDLERARAAGCTLFQGDFFARPKVRGGRRLPADHLLLPRLVARLQERELDFDELEKLVSANVGVSYKLLRYVNSASVGMRVELGSTRHALVILGLARVRAYVSMLLLAGIEGKPHELVMTALVRARS
jgi:EAL and modified HD-GYP domain-containing signal transduction protein